MKKIVKLLGVALLSLGGCWFIGQQMKAARLNPEAEEKAAWNLVDYIDTPAARLHGRMESEDYPYGYNLGVIEDDEVGRAVLLTMGTEIEIEGTVSEGAVLELGYEIHPWVAAESDGAILNLVIAGENREQDYTYAVGSNLQKQSVPLEQFAGEEVRIQLSVSNEEGKNEICDWVILEEFSFEQGKFVGKRPSISDWGYIRSATYFADEWPLNFWNSEMDALGSDMKQIREDGFDSIILVIPWREFQPEMSPVSFNEYAFGKLDEVMAAARQEGLGVYVRVGYEPDLYDRDEESGNKRHFRLMWEADVAHAWEEYLERLYTTLSAYENFKGGFLTWEDFWNNLAMCDEPEESEPMDRAALKGYRQWVEENYTLEGYNEKYGTRYASFAEIPIPRRTEPAMEAMYRLYDAFLNEILETSQEIFPNLSMEVRTDLEPVSLADGTTGYYEHADTYSCMNSEYVVTMYGIPMGFANVGERVSYREAMEKTDYILGQLQKKNGGKPIYVDQFLFADNTPAFSENAQIKEEEINDYLENIADVLLRRSGGYGIWTYRDYRANLLYNSQFVLEADGWNVEGDVSWEKAEGSAACRLGFGGRIDQLVPVTRNHFGNGAYTFEADIVEVEEAGSMTVRMGELQETVEISEAGRISLTFDGNESLDLAVESVDCSIVIDNLRVYNYIQRGFLYDEDNNVLQCLEALRSLNSQLQQAQ